MNGRSMFPPGGPPFFSRVQLFGMHIRQAEYHRSLLCVDAMPGPSCLRDFEIASSAHDALTAHHDRGFDDLDLFLRTTFDKSP